jgi:NADPH:quinone reductase-like Zn-dependent oxidoreductase
MKAMQVTRFGAPELLALSDIEKPRADRDSAIVEVRAAAINPSDVKNVAGLMSQTTLPRVPGRDFAGIVVEGPSEWLGKEVWGSGGQFGFTIDGAHAEFMRVPLEALSQKPACLGFVQAASVGVAYTVAWQGLIEYARTGHGETVAVIGAAGSVGQAVTQLARWRGSRVIGVTREPLSASDAVLFDGTLLSDADLPERLRQLTEGRGADVVYDAVGGVMFEAALRCLAHRGRLVEISATGASRVSFDVRDFYHNESQLFGADSLKLDGAQTARLLDELAPLFDDGTLQAPQVQNTIPLIHAVDAYQRVARGEGGRQVIVPGAME